MNVRERSAGSIDPITLGLASHTLAGIFPFMAASAISRLGLIPATAWIYGIGALGLLAALVVGDWRRAFIAESTAMWQSAFRGRLILGLGGFLVAGVAYYSGLAHSPRVAEYVFITRLDWLLQAPVAILLLNEPWTRQGLVGGLVALTGGVMLAWTGALGTSGLVAALLYIAASLAGYGGVKPISAARGTRGAVTLMVWRHWINALGFAALLATQPAAAVPDGVGMLMAAAGSVAIILLFLLRFAALTRLPLWVLSVQAPVQAIVAILVTLATGSTLPLPTLTAIALVVAGEALVGASHARRFAADGPSQDGRSTERRAD